MGVFYLNYSRYNEFMHKKHNSHHIFLFLGLLVLLFIIVFGIRHFQSEYSYSDNEVIFDNSQNYQDGVPSENPFTVPLEEDLEQDQIIIPITDPSIPDYVPGE